MRSEGVAPFANTVKPMKPVTKTSKTARILGCYGRFLRHPGQWRVLNWGRSVTRCRVIGEQLIESRGLRWQLDPADHQQAGVYWLGEMDRWEIFHLRQTLDKESVFFDVGANFGYYSIRLSYDAGCRTFAFEPQSEVRERLLVNVRLNQLEGRITVIPAALADREAMLKMAPFQGNSGKASLSEDEGDVVVRKLDDVVTQMELERLDAIKMDVEGYEPRVLEGAEMTLSRFKPVLLLEVNPSALNSQNSSARDLENILRRMKYSFFEIHRRRLIPIDGFSKLNDTANIFCRSFS
jgi:FkbM family methyltransferase